MEWWWWYVWGDRFSVGELPPRLGSPSGDSGSGRGIRTPRSVAPPPLLSALQRKHAAQLRAEPRFSPQLEAMRVAQRMLLGGRKFGDAYELQEVLRAREVEEREAARKKTRAANAAALQVGGKVPD